MLRGVRDLILPAAGFLDLHDRGDLRSTLDTAHRPMRVLLVCSGLEHARRGFESFARECFDNLRDDAEVDLELVKGSGAPGPLETVVPVLRRDRRVARGIARALRVRPFRVEALSFAVALQRLIARRDPDLIYLSEWDTARGLAALRTITGARFRLLLCNGGFAARGFDHLDHVQQLTPAALEYVLARGANPARHTALPLGFAISPRLAPATAEERRSTRERYGLPLGRRILISVAALNRSHKRLHYLIEEAANIHDGPFVLMLGEPDAETPAVEALARERLGQDAHRIMTASAAEVPAILRASDAFVLTSVTEMQGRALVEAMSQGLLCLAHESPVMRFALGTEGEFADFTRPGVLRSLILRHMTGPQGPTDRRAVAGHRYVYEQFSWDKLRPRYIELFARAAGARGPRHCQTAANSTVSSSTAA